MTKTFPKTYHHGDLRAALVAEGLNLLRESDVEHLSLREVARRVGVSATAVYRHFPDKQALLSALAYAGGAELERRQRAAQAAAGAGYPGFDATGREYVHFAVENPALFRLMMVSARSASRLDASERHEQSLELLRQNIDVILGPDVSAEDKRLRAVQAWAIVHGLAMLILDGQVPGDKDMIDGVIDSTRFWGKAVHSLPPAARN